MLTRSAALALGAALMTAVSIGNPVGADPPGPPVVDDPRGSVTTVIRSPGAPGSAPGAPTVSAERISLKPCVYRYDPTGAVGENFDFNRPDAPTQQQLESGQVRWYAVSCPGQAEYPIFTALGRQLPGPPPPTPAEVAVVARRVLHLPFPSVRHNPPDEGLAQLGTWLWLDGGSWQVRSSTLTLRGTSVTVFAKPVQVTWVTGDGATLKCDGPGVVYDPRVPVEAQSTYCRHTYRRSSAHEPRATYTGTATALWQIRWVGSLPGGATQDGELPALELTSPFELRVREVQDLVTTTT